MVDQNDRRCTSHRSTSPWRAWPAWASATWHRKRTMKRCSPFAWWWLEVSKRFSYSKMHYRYQNQFHNALSIPDEFQKNYRYLMNFIMHYRYLMNSKMHYRYSKDSFWTLTVPKLVRNNLELDFKRFPPWKSSRTNWIVYAHSCPFCLALIDRSHGLFAVRLESSFMQQPKHLGKWWLIPYWISMMTKCWRVTQGKKEEGRKGNHVLIHPFNVDRHLEYVTKQARVFIVKRNDRICVYKFPDNRMCLNSFGLSLSPFSVHHSSVAKREQQSDFQRRITYPKRKQSEQTRFWP